MVGCGDKRSGRCNCAASHDWTSEGAEFSAIVPPDSFVPGANEVTFHRIEDTDDGPVLHRLTATDACSGLPGILEHGAEYSFGADPDRSEDDSSVSDSAICV